MKLTAKGRYAVMAMADLANFNKQQKPVSLNDISIRQGISLSFLEQLFLKLKKKDLVTSVRGNLGGYDSQRSQVKFIFHQSLKRLMKISKRLSVN